MKLSIITINLNNLDGLKQTSECVLNQTFSENLCNGKLGYALQRKGWEMDVISKHDEGPTYSAEWVEPWTAIRDGVHEIKYSVGNKLIKGS